MYFTCCFAYLSFYQFPFSFFKLKIRLKEVMCLGVTAGAYILTLFAVSHQYPLIRWHTVIF